jgi:hypothetical protein
MHAPAKFVPSGGDVSPTRARGQAKLAEETGFDFSERAVLPKLR